MIAPISLSRLAHKYGGVLLEPDCRLGSLSIDTRTLDSGQVFVALKGDNFDGHEYLDAAIDKGASALVTEQVHPQRSPQGRAPQWVVKNSLRALGQIGAENRNMFTGKLIALTGSNGKTSVKEMIASILGLAGEVMATRGNLNNHIGVPLTLMSLNSDHEFAVVEMGASGLGEIHYLTGLAQPDVALVNNVGDAHIGEFGGAKNIEIGKGEIFDGLSSSGTGVVNLDSPGATRYSDKLIGRKMICYSAKNPDADLYASDIQYVDGGSRFVLKTSGGDAEVVLSVPAEHSVLNALAAAACCRAIDIPVQQIAAGLQSFGGVKGRLQRHRLANGALVIDDTYNASPSSVKAAICALASMSGRKTLVLGAMAELGEQSDSLHAEVGRMAREQGIEHLVSVGNEAAPAASGFGSGAIECANKNDAVAQVLESLDGRARILVKGSRSSRMEDVVYSLLDKEE